jgi:hypothetical protein
MSVIDLSLRAITTELISFGWPVLVGVGGAQVVVTRRIVSGGHIPSKSSVVSASAASLACSAVIAVDIVNSVRAVVPDETGFSFAESTWSLFRETMWPVLAGFGVAQISLIAVSCLYSRRILTTASLASTLMASWMVAWWLFLGSRSQLFIRLAAPMPWLIVLLACSCGLVFSTTTVLISRRIALTRGLRALRDLRG